DGGSRSELERVVHLTDAVDSPRMLLGGRAVDEARHASIQEDGAVLDGGVDLAGKGRLDPRAEDRIEHLLDAVVRRVARLEEGRRRRSPPSIAPHRVRSSPRHDAFLIFPVRVTTPFSTDAFGVVEANFGMARTCRSIRRATSSSPGPGNSRRSCERSTSRTPL